MYNPLMVEQLVNDKLRSLREEGMREQMLKEAGISYYGPFLSFIQRVLGIGKQWVSQLAIVKRIANFKGIKTQI